MGCGTGSNYRYLGTKLGLRPRWLCVDHDRDVDSRGGLGQRRQGRDVDAARSGYDRLTMPKCLIWGEQDHPFPLAQAARLVEMLPSPVYLEPVPSAAMLVHEEQPGAWLAIVRDFLTSSPARGI